MTTGARNEWPPSRHAPRLRLQPAPTYTAATRELQTPEMQRLWEGGSCGTRWPVPLFTARRSTLRRVGRVIAEADIERLATELLLASADHDLLGVRGAFLAINDLDDADRSTVLARTDRLGAHALGALAIVWDVTPAEALRRLTGG